MSNCRARSRSIAVSVSKVWSATATPSWSRRNSSTTRGRKECISAGEPLADADRRARDLLDPDEGPLDLGVEGKRLLGRLQPAPAPAKQRQAEIEFHVAQQPAHRRLGDAQGFR